jgi:hypothetical protein
VRRFTGRMRHHRRLSLTPMKYLLRRRIRSRAGGRMWWAIVLAMGPMSAVRTRGALHNAFAVHFCALGRAGTG